jgi:hypothetical protein
VRLLYLVQRGGLASQPAHEPRRVRGRIQVPRRPAAQRPPYTYANNNRYAPNAQQLYGGDALWYVLAKDQNGKVYRGLGLLETESTPLGPPTAAPAR